MELGIAEFGGALHSVPGHPAIRLAKYDQRPRRIAAREAREIALKVVVEVA